MDLIGYLSSGYPSKEGTLENAAAYIEGGCDVLEIDLPTDNPYLDGELIQHRMIHSFKKDSSLQSQVDVIRKIRKQYPLQRIFLLAYETTIVHFGIDAYIQLYKEINAEALILVGTDGDTVKNQLINHGIRIATYIHYDLPKKEIKAAQKTNGFVYLQSKPSKNQKSNRTLAETISYLKEDLKIQVPIYCGVGISSPEDVKRVKFAGAQGAFVGSGILTRENDKNGLIKYLKELKKATK